MADLKLLNRPNAACLNQTLFLSNNIVIAIHHGLLNLQQSPSVPLAYTSNAQAA